MGTNSFVQLPPDGAGKKLHTIVHEDLTHNQIMTVGDPNSPTNLQYVDQYGAAYIRFAEGNQIFDSFGKTKMSQETMIGEYMPRYNSLPELIQTKIVGTASETYLPDASSVRLQTGTNLGDLAQRTTNKYHKYYPGTSQLMEFTITLGDSGKANVVRQWGYYDDKDGIILKVNGTAFEIVIRSSATGSIVETVIPQADFNIDRGDGLGVSGVIMDPSKTNLYWIDLQYLGAGRVRIGAYSTDGQRVVFHQIENANNNPSVYMSTGSLPLRWEQYNSGIAASTSEMTIHNAVVYTESQNIETRGYCFSTAAFGALPSAHVSNADGTFSAMVSIRPKATFNGKINHNIAIPNNMFIKTDKPLQISIMKDANIGTPVFSSIHNESFVEKAGGLTLVDINNSRSVYCIMVDTGITHIDISNSFSYFTEALFNKADGTQPTYTIICRTFDGTAASVIGGITWHELIV